MTSGFWSEELERQNCCGVGRWQESFGYRFKPPIILPIRDAERVAGGMHLDSRGGAPSRRVSLQTVSSR